jgi:predicted RNA-binding Zn-ribbon protein involved in translation (DUF1610 family)
VALLDLQERHQERDADPKSGPVLGVRRHLLRGGEPKAMNEKDVVELLGPPDEIVGRGDRMRSRAWKCSTCITVFEAVEPITAPAPCPKCGEVIFEVVRRLSQ